MSNSRAMLNDVGASNTEHDARAAGKAKGKAARKIVVNHTQVKPVVISLSFMQLVFWLSLTVITYFSLTLWYGTFEWHILHTVVQSILGYLITIPMHRIYRSLWGQSLPRLALVSLATVIVASLIWSAARMWTFIVLTGASLDQWQDFGGWYFSAFFIFLCWTAIYYNFLYYRLAALERDRRIQQVERAREEKMKRYHAEQLASESRLQMLRYQLNPHFLFNTLNAISSLVAAGKNAPAREMIDKLSWFLRYSLTDEQTTAVDLRREMQALEHYLSIEKTRFSDRLHIEYDLAEESLSAKVPSLILQPLIENAIKYAIGASENGGTISIMAVVADGRLRLCVADDGPGIVDLAPGIYHKDEFHFGGVGLRNTHDRLESLYGDAYEMNLNNRDSSGLKIELVFPFEQILTNSKP
ncbi:MAG: histidine kinase [Pseudomonadales bacterium]|nr:histidine kinase [Pseudomonadales bacterium]